ncbi:Cell division cycle protein [Podosphaera aphanis]|nr:Cell division cycle protein [Podosphaera aphanis]
MPAFYQTDEPPKKLPFNPITRSHILHCSYSYWHPRYRSSALKSKIIPLSSAFLDYLRADGIVLSHELSTLPPNSTHETTFPSSLDNTWDDEPGSCPSLAFPEIHQQIKDTIAEFGGLVAPKLNWSAPKDATWISVKKNSMECATPNDIYLLLKTSDFVTHDLEHAFDDTVCDQSTSEEKIEFVLVLRKWFHVNPSCEFRCFVRDRRVIGICQRDQNYFDFLFPLANKIRDSILKFFEKTLQETFPEPDFVFDIYLPKPFERVRLIDINPWAPRTDPLLFSWIDLLSFPLPEPTAPDSSRDQKSTEEFPWKPEIRLVGKDDPQAYNFSSTKYSAHKLPQEVVQAGMEGESGIRDFSVQWKMMISGQAEMRTGYSSDEDDDRFLTP